MQISFTISASLLSKWWILGIYLARWILFSMSILQFWDWVQKLKMLNFLYITC